MGVPAGHLPSTHNWDLKYFTTAIVKAVADLSSGLVVKGLSQPCSVRETVPQIFLSTSNFLVAFNRKATLLHIFHSVRSSVQSLIPRVPSGRS